MPTWPTQGLYGRSVGATLVGSLYGALVVATPKDNSKRAWAKTDRRWASGKRQINRRGHRSTQGHLRPGAPQGQDAGWSFGPLGGQDGGLHLRTAAQQPARATAAPPSRPFGLSGYASLVLEVLVHRVLLRAWISVTASTR